MEIFGRGEAIGFVLTRLPVRYCAVAPALRCWRGRGDGATTMEPRVLTLAKQWKLAWRAMIPC